MTTTAMTIEIIMITASTPGSNLEFRTRGISILCLEGREPWTRDCVKCWEHARRPTGTSRLFVRPETGQNVAEDDYDDGV